jgi:uncharacterized protein (TIGR00266 family)
MNVEILPNGAFYSALVHLNPGDRFQSDSGAMFRASSNVDIDVTTRPKGRGAGMLGGLKRMLSGDSFFLSTYSITDGSPGEVGLSPTLQGEVRRVDVDGGRAWMCSGGSYLGSDSNLFLDLQFQGLKGLFSGENLFFVKVEGRGDLLVNAYGRITEVEVDGELTVDTGHVVAFEDSLSYKLTKATDSWVQSFLAGEGFVLRFSGKGKLLVQSHNPKEFGSRLGKRLPPRRR